MAVVIETTLGDITVDLFLEQRPVTCLNFLKLCKMKYYNFNLFHSIRSGFIAQTGDPSGEGSGGQSIFGLLEGPTKQFFSGEKMPKIRHTDAGLLSMVCTDDMMVGSQFFFTLAPDLDSLDGVHCVIGEVTEGHEVLRKLNEVICDESHRPYQDVRITHTVVLEDPFNDPNGFRAPSRSPSPSAERLRGGRIAPDEEINETQGKTAEEVQEMIEEKEAKARATILEIVGDLPDADIAPPENVLFVCKLNPVTTDEDLEIIFSRFGTIVNCEVIRDKKSGDSLQYAFIEFSDKKSCEDAYFKMDNVLIDDRRIHVDFSQSVSKMKWLGKGRGVKYFNDDGDENVNNHSHSRSKRSQSKDRKKSKSSNHSKDKNNRDKKYESSRYPDDRHKHHKSDRENSHRRERSQSRSKVSSRDIKENRHYSDKQIFKSNEKTGNEKTNRNRESHNNSHKSRSQHSPEKHKTETRKSPLAKKRDKSKIHWAENGGNSSSRKRHTDTDKESLVEEKNKVKRKRSEKCSDSLRNSKKFKKNDHNLEPRTPSPARQSIGIDKKRKDMKKNRVIKKKRKPSTSSSSETSDSSSSSSSTSSSEEDRKRKKSLKRHVKKYSSSSSSDSSDSSSSSSTSSDSSSESSSSSSDSEPSKRKKVRSTSKKSIHKKTIKKK